MDKTWEDWEILFCGRWFLEIHVCHGQKPHPLRLAGGVTVCLLRPL